MHTFALPAAGGWNRFESNESSALPRAAWSPHAAHHFSVYPLSSVDPLFPVRAQKESRMTTEHSENAPRRFSRRHFLGTVGAGAAATLGGGAVAGLGVDHAAAATAASRSDRFGRLLPNLPPFAEATPAVVDALTAFGAKDGPLDAQDDMRPVSEGGPGPLGLILNPGRNEDSSHPAGLTFVGQFIDHDITFDLNSRLGEPTPPETSPNSRDPRLNLDSVYGGGFGDTRFVLPDGTMRVERVDASNPGSREDLPRLDGTALIADPRNDENLMIADSTRRSCFSTTTPSRRYRPATCASASPRPAA